MPGFSGSGMGRDAVEGPVSAARVASAAAHSLQNLAPARLGSPHEGHGSTKGAAHSLQNFAPSGLSKPQLAQRIDLLGNQAPGAYSSIAEKRRKRYGYERELFAQKEILGCERVFW